MRKYLITGVLALAAGGFLTSCHDTEGAYSSIVEQKLQAYEQVFKEEFGEIDPNQDWGFGETSTSAARTRTRASAEPTANIWANQGYKSPTELTEGQRLRVKAYFQANPNLTYVDPGYTNFFVQQVYKGGTDPGDISDEVYYAVNGNPVVGSDHMDHLTFGMNANGTAKDHVYNFNHGRYSDYQQDDPNGKPRENVQNYPNVTYHTTYLGQDGVYYHQDHIMLMLGSSTECVGFISSENSREHNDCMALAGAATIDAWAKDPANYVDGKPIGEDVVDEWDRSFVGLDYEQMEIEQAYTNPKKAAKALDFKADGSQYVIYNNTITKVEDFNDFVLKDKYNHDVLYVTEDVSNMAIGKKMKIIENGVETNNDVNRSTFNYNMSKAVLEATYKTTLQGNTDIQIFNLDMVIDYAKDNCLPTEQNKNWIKDLGGRDYVFSDWIITLTSADPTHTTTIPIEPGGGTKKGSRITTYMWELTETQKGRIMCEDLGVIKASDIDFNDLVFDAYIYNAQKKKKVVTVDENNNIVSGPTITDENESTRLAEIYILAAGGTLPISVAGERVKDHFSDENRSGSLSDAFIVNTCTRDGDGDGGAYSNPWWNYNTAQKIEKFDDTQTMTLKDIKVIVQYGSKILELYSERGLAPHKICVPLDLASGVNVKWPLERVVIKEAYEDFTKYVKDEDETIVFTPDANSESGAPDSDGTNPNGVSYFNREQSNTCWTRTEKINPDKLFNETVNYTPRNLNSDADTNGKYYIISTSSEEVDIPDTSKGYQQGETILVRRRH